jgi:hypothetical protein
MNAQGRSRLNTDFLKRFSDKSDCLTPDVLDIDPELTNICWLPIRNAKIEPDNWELFWRLWEKDKLAMSSNGNPAIWESLCIWRADRFKDEDSLQSAYPQKAVDWSKHFPQLFKNLFQLMPYKEIFKITLASNISRVPAHVDRSFCLEDEILTPWPNTIRVILHDKNPRPTFYLTRWPKEILDQGKIKNFKSIDEWILKNDPSSSDKCYVQLPEDSNTFIFSNGEFLHGADFMGHSKIVLLIWGRPDAEPWKQKLRDIQKNFPQYTSICRF